MHTADCQDAQLQQVSNEVPPEELVTFQVALIGIDGLVVGTDRRVLQASYPPDEGPVLQPSESEKFCKSTDGRIICFYAGQDTAVIAARAIATQCRPIGSQLEWENDLSRIADSVPRPLANPSDQILVVRTDVRNGLWLVTRRPALPSSPRKVLSYCCTGDNLPARFLAQHLSSRTHGIAELERLALLTLSYASLESGTSIAPPFDVMTLDKDGNVKWSLYEFPNEIHTQFDLRFRQPL